MLPEPHLDTIQSVVLDHLERLYEFDGSFKGVLIARKHIAWYCRNLPEQSGFRALFNMLNEPGQQQNAVRQYFASLHKTGIGQKAAA